MQILTILVVLQAVVLGQAQLYIEQTSNCNWFFTSRTNAGRKTTIASFNKQTLYSLATEICYDLNCGDVYQLDIYPTLYYETCLTDCIYDDKKRINCKQTFETDCSTVSNVICAKLYVEQITNCTWFFTLRENAGENRSIVIFKNQTLYPLATQICHDLNCGDVYQLHINPTTDNETCLTDCMYNNKKLFSCKQSFEKDCSIVSKVICGTPYKITAINSRWNIWSLKTKSGVILTAESVESLANDICEHHGSGEVFQINSVTARPNSSCLNNCTYSNNFLWNCTSVHRNNCLALSEVICGNQAVRLVGGSHRCAGRVELWHAGQWGTVCDDGWDTSDADVVCAQLNCGYAISVTGQGDPYSPGKGLIFMDELNCTGKESNLWECPAVRGAHDCGHKEDAGVICSEYKALRLTGGLDRCSGRVEIHRNGLWGTVCYSCWQKHEANMACSMLGCGGVKQFIGFEKPFTHKNGTHWFYNCDTSHKILWECKELNWTIHFLCEEAAGMICDNSLGLPDHQF